MPVEHTCNCVCVLSCVDVIQSFTYVLRVVILDVTKRRGGETAREKARGNTNGLSHIPSKEKKKKKKKDWESLAVARLLFFTSNLQLPSTIYIHKFQNL